MDPFSAEGELINIHSAFHYGQYQAVLDFDTTSLSPENTLPARIYKYRAQIALNQFIPVLTELKGTDEPALQAVASLALLRADQAEKALALAERLAGEHAGDRWVQVLAGTVLQASGKSEEALALLGNHQRDLEAVALIVQIYLVQNRVDLAIKEIKNLKSWAQDSVLANFAEAWVDMRVGGARYQQAYYVFQEAAENSATSSVRTLVAQALADLHQGRIQEAQPTLEEAIEKEPTCAEAIASLLVLAAVDGKDVTEYANLLKQVQPSHALLTDLVEKSDLFDQAAAKYSPSVPSA